MASSIGSGWRFTCKFSTCDTPASVISLILQQALMMRVAKPSITSTLYSGAAAASNAALFSTSPRICAWHMLLRLQPPSMLARQRGGLSNLTR